MLEIGTVIGGKYKIQSVLGRGGMSVVYLAVNEKANKPWAVKELVRKEFQELETERKEIALMKKNAILLNTARGPVVDSEALAKALNEERIAGAGIDVFEMEPPVPADHPLLHSKHTVVTPHVAFASHEALFTRAQIVSENILKWEDGKPQNVIC